MQITKQLTPEDRELQAKQAQLASLESDLTTRELDLATLHADLASFEKRYISIVGKRYAELDDLLAQIAEAEARLDPQDSKITQNAAQVRQQATESASAASSVDSTSPPPNFQPSETLKKLYRQIAKTLHPDLGNSEADRARRHSFMARVNQAYAAGDEDALRAILQEWQSSPESVTGDSIGADLIRTIRKIARIQDRLRAITAEIATLQSSSLYTLKTKTAEAETQNRDLLAETAAHIATQIAEARVTLAQFTEGGP